MTVLVGKERESGTHMGTGILQKRGCGMFTVDTCREFIIVGIPSPNPNTLMFRTMLDDLGLELGALGRQHYSTVIKF